MKINLTQVLIIVFVVLSFFGVSYFIEERKEPEKFIVKKDSEEGKYVLVDVELEDSQEKIMLLSYIKKMPKDSIKLILREYLMESEFDVDFEEAVLKVAKKYSISSSKVASLVFSYKYELLTQDDIQDKAIENIGNEEPN
nr:hypothetical protein [uncultured Flavobacterium sp.]